MHDSRLLLSASLALLASACSSTPREIRIDQSAMNVYSRDATPLRAQVVGNDGKAIDGIALTYTAAMPEVASADAQGDVRCHKSGDAAVVVAGSNLNATVRVACRLASSILVPPLAQRLLLGGASQAIPASVMNERGSLIENAPLVLTSSDASIVHVDGRQLVAKGVGNATVKVALGQANADLAVEVVEVVQRHSLALGDGATQVFTLNPGAYEIDIVGVAGGGFGVTAQWVGASCPPAKESQRHHIRCAFSEPASLRVENPTVLGMGDLAAGHLTVYRIAAL